MKICKLSILFVQLANKKETNHIFLIFYVNFILMES